MGVSAKKISVGRYLFSFRALLIAVFAVFFALRVIHLTADPPKDLSWSLGLFFDEGIYNHNARNQILFGQWKLDEWNDFYYSPIAAILKYLTFLVIGVGRIQMRLFSVIFSIISLLFAYLVTKESYGRATGLIALLFLGANYVYLMYNRLGMQDTPTLAIFFITFYFWQKGVAAVNARNRVWYFLLAGLMYVVTYTFKSLFLYLLPTPFVALGLYLFLQFREKPVVKKLLTALGFFSFGCMAGFAIWYVSFYRHYQEVIRQFGRYMMGLMFPTPVFAQLVISIHRMPFFRYFSYTPIVLFGAGIFLIYLTFLLCSEQRSRIHPTDLFLALWFLAALGFLSILSYRPTRYFLPIIPPMCLLAARGLSVLGGIAERIRPTRLHKAVFPMASLWLAIMIYYTSNPPDARLLDLRKASVLDIFNVPLLLISIGCAVAVIVGLWHLLRRLPETLSETLNNVLKVSAIAFIVCTFYIELRLYYQWVRAPQYDVPAMGREFAAMLGPDAYIGGMDAPGAAFDTPYKTLFSWDNFVNYAENPITHYGLTHLFLGDSPSVREVQYYFEKYPREMGRARLLRQYPFKQADAQQNKDTVFNLYVLTEPRIEKIILPDTEFSSRQSVSATIQVQNNDYRQHRRVSVNWFLYPKDLPQDGSPACTGQSVERWLAPYQEVEFAISGMLPEQPGKYLLLASVEPAKEYRVEAEELDRHLGKIETDLQAIGHRVVYHHVQRSSETGFLVFGGDYPDFQPGVYETAFRLKVGDATVTDEVVRIEAVSAYGKHLLSQRILRGTDFSGIDGYQDMILPFLLNEFTPGVEFRVFSFGKTDIGVDTIYTTCREGVWYRDKIKIQ